jgi:mono/diheme cytochrome c family protein
MRRFLLNALLSSSALMGVAQAATPLRLCADPENLPFSTASAAAATAGARGLYVDIGQAVADALGRPMQTVWSLSYFGKRNIRKTMLEGHCDFAVGLPAVEDFMGPRLIMSRSIFSLGYVLAVGRNSKIVGLDDLVGKRVAVQFGTPPQSFLATRDAIEGVTVMDPDEGMRLLGEGRVDAAFVWGPSAGYVNHTLLHDAFAILPVDAPQMRYAAAIGFGRENKALRDQVDAALPDLAPKIAALVARYSLPADEAPHEVGVTLVATTKEGQTEIAQTGPSPVEVKTQATEVPPKAEATAQTMDAAAEGREIFNGTCGHCHGPDGIQSERRINLRLLKHRYGETMQEVFHTTVTKGRPSKGMPPWEGVFTEDNFSKIYAFLSTIQDP